MAVKLIAKFVKPGAVFSNAEAAAADRKSLFTDDLIQRMGQSYKLLKDSGIIISGPDIFWDPDTYMLTIERVVTDYDEFKNYYTQVGGTVRNEIYTASTDADWQQIDFLVVPIE
jgi:hypothetical protein